MSTQTVEQTGALLELPIVTEPRTYSRVVFRKNVVNEKDGSTAIEESRKVMSQDDANAAVEAAKGDGSIEVEATQTFGFDHGNTVEALQEIYGNDKELCKQTNNATDVKLGNRVRSLMLAQDENGEYTFQPQEGQYNLREFIGQESAARGKSDLEKAKTILAKLPEDQRRQLLAMLQAAQSEE